MSYNPTALLSNSADNTNSLGNYYQNLGIVNPHYATALSITNFDFARESSTFSSINAAERLGSFFTNIFTAAHLKHEVPAIKARALDDVTKQTVDGYINHASAAGENILAALGTFRVVYQGNESVIRTNESFTACSHYNLMANTAITNASFIHNSAKQEVKTVGLYSQATDFWQGASKYVWWRAEKHFQVQAATLGLYSSESYEENHNAHYETSAKRVTQGASWNIKLKSSPSLTSFGNDPSFYLTADKYIALKAKDDLSLNTEKDLLVQAKNAYLQAEQAYIKASRALTLAADKINISASAICTISGSTIFLTSGVGGISGLKPAITPPDPGVVRPVDAERLPFYAKQDIPANGPAGVTVIGNDTMQNPIV